jgi:hypothetical protein
MMASKQKFWERKAGYEKAKIQTRYLSLSIAENNSLGDGECIIKITKSIKLPFLFLNSNKELFDTLQTRHYYKR